MARLGPCFLIWSIIHYASRICTYLYAHVHAFLYGKRWVANGDSVAMRSAMFEESLEAKLPTILTDGKAQPGRSSDMEKVRREKIRDGEDQRGRKPEERSCRRAKR